VAVVITRPAERVGRVAGHLTFRRRPRPQHLRTTRDPRQHGLRYLVPVAGLDEKRLPRAPARAIEDHARPHERRNGPARVEALSERLELRISQAVDWQA
jgi:hypothetical protein